MNRINLGLAALVASAWLSVPVFAQAQTQQSSSWGNFNWSQLAAPQVSVPQTFAPATKPAQLPPSTQPSAAQAYAQPPKGTKPVPFPPRRAAPPASASAPPAPSTTLSAVRPSETLADEPAPPPAPPPLALLLDGLGIYVEQKYVGVSALEGPLKQQGYRTIVDNHFARKAAGQVPNLIIGHSMGGQSALKIARQLVQAGNAAPLVITIDAAPMPIPCPVPRCINIVSPAFPLVAGAQNISAWQNGAYLVSHAMLASDPEIQRMILQYSAALIGDRGPRPVARRLSGG